MEEKGLVKMFTFMLYLLYSYCIQFFLYILRLPCSHYEGGSVPDNRLRCVQQPTVGVPLRWTGQHHVSACSHSLYKTAYFV